MDYSLEQIAVVINGHTVTGWGDDTDALSLPNIDLASVIRGAGGKMISVSTGEKGGPVIFKLLPNSPSTKFFMNAIAAQNSGASMKWNGSIRDSVNQVNIILSNGTLTNGPLGQTIGKGAAANREFTIEFETVTPDYMAATQ